MYADMRVEQMNRIRVNISALDALVLGLDEISLFLVLVGIKCENIIAVQVYDMKRDVSGIVICLVILHLLEGTIHGCESAMNVRDMVADVGISIDACNLLRHFLAVASVRDEVRRAVESALGLAARRLRLRRSIATSVDDVSCCVCEKKAIRYPIDSAP